MEQKPPPIPNSSRYAKMTAIEHSTMINGDMWTTPDTPGDEVGTHFLERPAPPGDWTEWRVWNRQGEDLGRRRYEACMCLDQAMMVNGDIHVSRGIYAPGIWRERGPDGGTMIPWGMGGGWYEFVRGEGDWGYVDVDDIGPAVRPLLGVYESEGVCERALTGGDMGEGLCQSCVSSPFMSLPSQSLQETVFTKSFSQTRESATVCRLCAMVFESLKYVVNGSLGEQDDDISVCVPLLDAAKEPMARLPNVLVVSGTEMGIMSILPPAGGQAHFSLLNSWLKTCDESHKHPKSFSAELPTRVIKVGEVSDPSLLCLHTSTPSERGTYIALSHCWGHSRAFTTTKGTLNARTSSIDYNELPPTFQDAITVARQLGVQYLWIDSLCIIQDDPDDWTRESARMEKVFVSAYCIVAATSAVDSARGFLIRSSETSVRLAHPGKDNANDLFLTGSSHDFKVDVENAPLNQRAWVLQERALSRRTIHFSSTQTYWECGSCHLSETNPSPSVGPMGELDAQPDNLLASSKFPHGNFKTIASGEIYKDVFESYSKLALTYKRDRPRAVVGIESRLAMYYDSPSVYGILMRFLGSSLFWERAENEIKGLKRIEDFQSDAVPSWSWMCWDGTISYRASRGWSLNHIRWNGDVKLGGTPRNAETGGFRFLLGGEVAISKRNCKIRDVEGGAESRVWMGDGDSDARPVGWAKLDCVDVDLDGKETDLSGFGYLGLGDSTDMLSYCVCNMWGAESDACARPCSVVYCLLLRDSGTLLGSTKIYHRAGVVILQRSCLLMEKTKMVCM